jgi:hypothetical protein
VHASSVPVTATDFPLLLVQAVSSPAPSTRPEITAREQKDFENTGSSLR